MGELVTLDEYRPHIGVTDDDGNYHVIPAILLEEIAYHGKSFKELNDDMAPVIAAIIADWLEII